MKFIKRSVNKCEGKMKAFISYSHHDEQHAERLKAHLAVLRREGLISDFIDRDILAGENLDQSISDAMVQAQLFIAILSPDYFASDYCVNKEMASALDRQREGTMKVVSVVVEDCEWRKSPLSEFKVVPKDGRAVSRWTNENSAYFDVTTEIRRVCEASQTPGQLEPEQQPIAQSSQGSASRAKYRTKRSFDEIDVISFREKAFETIRLYFEEAMAEIAQVEGIRGFFRVLDGYRFTCTLLNEQYGRGLASITVRMSGGRHRFGGDISWCWEENAPDNTSHGHFSVGSTEYDQYLEGGDFSNFGRAGEQLSPDAAAEVLWTQFIEKAGISYA